MVTLAQAETIVAKHSNLFWEGWDVVIVNPKIDGYTKMAGIFFDGQWCVRKVIKADDEGLYNLPRRYQNAS